MEGASGPADSLESRSSVRSSAQQVAADPSTDASLQLFFFFFWVGGLWGASWALRFPHSTQPFPPNAFPARWSAPVRGFRLYLFKMRNKTKRALAWWGWRLLLQWVKSRHLAWHPGSRRGQQAGLEPRWKGVLEGKLLALAGASWSLSPSPRGGFDVGELWQLQEESPRKVASWGGVGWRVQTPGKLQDCGRGYQMYEVTTHPSWLAADACVRVCTCACVCVHGHACVCVFEHACDLPFRPTWSRVFIPVRVFVVPLFLCPTSTSRAGLDSIVCSCPEGWVFFFPSFSPLLGEFDIPG